jgi:hypothetical protein
MLKSATALELETEKYQVPTAGAGKSIEAPEASEILLEGAPENLAIKETSVEVEISLRDPVRTGTA